MQKKDAESKTKSVTDSLSEIQFVHQDLKPKVKHDICIKNNNVFEGNNGFSNGSPSFDKKISSIQNGASSSLSLSSSSTSSSSSSSTSSKTSSSSSASSTSSSSSSSSSSTSSTSSSSSSSSSVSEVLRPDNNSTSNAEKNVAKSRNLSSEESSSRYIDRKRKTGIVVDNESSSGNEGDEGLSGDDCCIYTYKGDQFADLPNSFFPVEMAEHEGDQQHREDHNNVNHRRRNQPPDVEGSNPGSSPEMDYLEMDFDPGPSLEQDSEEEEVDVFERKPINACIESDTSGEHKTNFAEDLSNTKIETRQDSQDPKPGPSNENFYLLCSPKNGTVSNFNSNNCSRTKEVLNGYFENCTTEECSDNCYLESGEVKEKIMEGEENNVNSFNSQSFGGRRLDKKNIWTESKELSFMDKSENALDSKMPFDGIMLWSEQEAIAKQVTIVSSEVSCGATAVINVMLVLKMRFSVEKVKEGISTRLRSDSASIPQYLISRSFAGVARENLIQGIHHASQGTLYAKFFQMYPRRDVVLSKWLFHWMKLGAVPIVTTNLQRDAATKLPTNETRHHQMIFGVSSKGIYLTNPLECLQDEELWSRLISPSILNIKRQEIVSRWSPETNLKPLMFQSDDRWKTMNVLGQVVNIIRECPDPSAQGKFLTPHISIPASSGITLVIPRDSSGYEELVSSLELPLSSQSKSK